jgi:hypothetical protein
MEPDHGWGDDDDPIGDAQGRSHTDDPYSGTDGGMCKSLADITLAIQ